MRGKLAALLVAVCAFVPNAAPNAHAADEPDLIFKRSTVFKWLTPNDKLATYGLDDPEVEGVACHFTVPEKGGFKGWIGVAEEVSDISLACRQIGPIRFKAKFEQGEDVFRQRRSLFFKKMQIVRGCDVKRNVLVYMVYSDRLIEGSPKNSTSSVPIMPWGSRSGRQMRGLDRKINSHGRTLPFHSSSTLNVLPTAVAARRSVASVTDGLLGSSRRSSWRRLVLMRAAIADLLKPCRLIATVI